MKSFSTSSYLLLGISLMIGGLSHSEAHSKTRPSKEGSHLAEKILQEPPSFEEHPQNKEVNCDAGSVMFSAEFNTSTTFIWQQSDDINFTDPVDLADDETYTISSEESISTLTVPSSVSLSGKYFRCVADPAGTPAPSEAALLTILSPTISYGTSPLIFSSDPAAVTLVGSSAGTFTASPDGLQIDASSGEINLISSSGGDYLVTFTASTPSTCASLVAEVAVKLQTATRTFTWTGATDDNWSTLANWLENSTIPVVLPSGGSQTGDDVIIPVVGSGNYPKVGAGATARSITVASGAKLDITSTGQLTVLGAGADGITNNGEFTNEGEVLIDSSYNDGFVNNIGASLINKKTLTISKGTGNRLENYSWVENFASSTVTINGGLETQVVNHNNATIKNSGTFAINAGQKGALFNEGTINNLSIFSARGGVEGSIVVNMDTLSNQADASFEITGGSKTSLDNANYWYNAGVFTMSSANNTDADPGVINRENAQFLNTSTANTTFSSSSYAGLVFRNDGYIESSSPLTIKNSGKGLLVNNVTGEIINNAELTLTNCTTDAFTNFGKFTNSATSTLNIEANGGSNYQINNSGVITTAAGCILNLSFGSKGVINNNNSSFSNKCATTYGAKGSAMVENNGTYIHDAGSITISGGTPVFINNTDTTEINVPITLNYGLGNLFVNSGILTLGENTVVTIANDVKTSLMINNSSTGKFTSGATISNVFCQGIIKNDGTMTLTSASNIWASNIGSPIVNTGNMTNAGILFFRAFGNYVVNNSGTFTNSGSLYSSNSTDAIRNSNGATMENSGLMVIDSIRNNGIIQETGSNSFTNSATGKITISYSTANGILNSSGTITNNGLIRVGDYGNISLDAIKNNGTITNGTGGKIYLRNALGSGINNDGGEITNQACASIESQMAIVNTSGTFLNAGLIHKLADTRTAPSNIGGNSGYVLNDDTDDFTYSGSNGPPPPTVAITSSDEVIYTGQTRTLTATPSDGVFDVTGPATITGNTLTATGVGTIVVSYSITESGCTYAATQIIAPLKITEYSVRPAGCNDATGSITVTTSGVGDFEYSKDGTEWQSSPTFAGLTTGEYNISARVASNTDYVAIYGANPIELGTYEPVASIVVPTSDVSTSYTCQTGDGWTLYTNEDGTETYFGVNWGDNEAAKNAAVLTMGETSEPYQTETEGLKKGTFTLPRYWNIDIGANTLTAPVSVSFWYNQEEKDGVVENAETFANDNSLEASGFAWFKTTGVNYDPAIHLTANGISGNPIKLTAVESEINGIKQVTFTGVASFSGGTGAVTVGSATPLPVTLVSFSGKPAENHIALNWKTTSEINASGFEVEKSFDAKTFGKIGYLSAKGTANSISNYDFNDSLPKPGLNYYRLKQLDLGGKFAYSTIIPVKWDGKGALTLYPNPATDQVELILPGASDIREVMIVSESGVVIKKTKPTGKIISVRGLPSGLYLMKIVTPNEVYTQKFVKLSR